MITFSENADGFMAARLGDVGLEIAGSVLTLVKYEAEEIVPCDDGTCPSKKPVDTMSNQEIDACAETCPFKYSADAIKEYRHGIAFGTLEEMRIGYCVSLREHQAIPYKREQMSPMEQVFGEAEWDVDGTILTPA